MFVWVQQRSRDQPAIDVEGKTDLPIQYFERELCREMPVANGTAKGTQSDV